MIKGVKVRITKPIEANTDVLTKGTARVVRRANSVIKPGLDAQVQQRVKQTPGRPRYPLRWKSERQRKAFFASNGFGRGIPYQRTGRMVNAWSVTIEPMAIGLRIVVENNARDDRGTYYAKFVVGEYQQPFHADTGWYKADEQVLPPMLTAGRRAADLYLTFFELGE